MSVCSYKNWRVLVSLSKKVSLAEYEPLITAQLAEGGSISFKVRGTSMRPMLSDRADTVTIVKPVAPPKKYDVIFYRRENGQFVLHRIIKVKKDGYVCRGDNQLVNEYAVTQDMIIGVLQEYTRRGKTKRADSLGQKIYAFFITNTALLRNHSKTLYNKLKRNF
jgi:hypothetical protein